MNILSSPPKTLFEADLEQIYARAQNDFYLLAGADLFLTGCTGFIGQWLIEALLWANENKALGCRLTVLTRDASLVCRSRPHWAGHDSIIWLEKDILALNFEDIKPFAFAVHGLNLPNDGSPSWPARHMAVAVEGTRRVIDVAARAGCRRLLLLSSGAVYNSFTPEQEPPFCEAGPWRPDFEPQVYAETKRFLEFYSAVLGAEAKVPLPLARLFTFFGPYMPLHARQALNSFFSDVWQDRNITVQGDGLAIRSYMYAADMVVWLLATLTRGRAGTPYNIGSEQAITVKDLAGLILEVSGKNLKINIQGLDRPGNAPSIYLPDTGRARNELGLSQQISLREGLERSWRWYSA